MNASRTRLPALDGLRGMAIILVVADHAAFGFLGVNVLFVSCGFLITSILLYEKDTAVTIPFFHPYVTYLAAVALLAANRLLAPKHCFSAAAGLRARQSWGGS